MGILKFIKDYWTQILFLISVFSAFIKIYKSNREATKCSLRNDILEIWDRCKETRTITKFQLESYTTSRDLYFKIGGNGFIHTLDKQIQEFEIID